MTEINSQGLHACLENHELLYMLCATMERYINVQQLKHMMQNNYAVIMEMFNSVVIKVSI